MEEQYKDSLVEAQLAVDLHQFARAKEILGALEDVYLPDDLQVDYWYFLGRAEIELNGFEASREHLLKALSLLEKAILADPLEVERVRYWVGFSFYRQHYFQQALEQFKLCWEGTTGGRILNDRFKLEVITKIASSHLGLKNYKHAIRTYKEALSLAKLGEDDLARASSYWGMAIAYTETSKLSAATGSWLRCAGIYERTGAKPLAARAKSLLSEILADRKLFDKSLEALEEALALTRSDDFATLSLIHLNQAYSYLSMGNYRQALESNEVSITHARKLQDNLLLGQGLSQMGQIHRALEDGNQALDYYKQAIEVLKKSEEKLALSKAYSRYSDVAKELGLFDEAFEALEAAYNC